MKVTFNIYGTYEIEVPDNTPIEEASEQGLSKLKQSKLDDLSLTLEPNALIDKDGQLIWKY